MDISINPTDDLFDKRVPQHQELLKLNPTDDLFEQCGCFLCKTRYDLSLPENNDTTKHPLAILQAGVISTPEISCESLVLDSQHISSIMLVTLNYLHIKSLSVRNNPLTFLPDIYTLHTLDCSNCGLTSLPSYMPVLTTLNCSANLIKEIPSYQRLTRLECSNNLITALPKLPKLASLTCNNNPLPQIHIPTLTYLEAYDCPILVLYDIPGLVRRSSTLDFTGSFQWITTRTEKINSKRILINWPARKIKQPIISILSRTRFWRAVLKYIIKEFPLKN